MRSQDTSPLLNSKQIQINNWSQWINELADQFDLFTTTVVFTSGGDSRNPEMSLSQYARVLRKIDKRLVPHNFDCRRKIMFGKRLSLEARNKAVTDGLQAQSDRLNRSICRDILKYYEHSERSSSNWTPGKKPVNHVHGIIGIPKTLTRRIWCFENDKLKPQMDKDLLSMGIISSVLFAPLRLAENNIWIAYIAKQKSFYENY